MSAMSFQPVISDDRFTIAKYLDRSACYDVLLKPSAVILSESAECERIVLVGIGSLATERSPMVVSESGHSL